MDVSGLTQEPLKKTASLPASAAQEGGRSLHISGHIKHGCSVIAREEPASPGIWRGSHCLVIALGLALGAGILASSPALAQIEMRDLNDLPDQRTLPPYLKYIPTDPHLVVRDYLRTILPAMWWGREMDYAPGRITVEIHPALNWKGNPTGMMIRFCPPSDHNLWRLYRQIELRPYYEKKYWPSYTCRRI